MIPNHDAHLEPPDPPVYRCVCGHAPEDHEDVDDYTDESCCACDCLAFAEYGPDERAADEADRYYDEMKTGGF